MKRILFINGHPDDQSFCAALETAYVAAAHQAGHDIHVLRIRELAFNPNLMHGYRVRQELEHDLLRAQDEIVKADHIVLLYPTWWGSLPAILKGFFDRTFHSGWAYKFHVGRLFPEKLLRGRTCHLITTMGGPSIWDFVVYRRSSYHTLKDAILEYCGITVKKFTVFGNMSRSTPEKRVKFLKCMEDLGRKGI